MRVPRRGAVRRERRCRAPSNGAPPLLPLATRRPQPMFDKLGRAIPRAAGTLLSACSH